MNSKERVLTAVARQQPDRVPITYLTNAGIDQRLRAHFGIAPDDSEGLLEALGVDHRGVGAAYIGPRLHPEKADRLVNPETGIVRRWIEHDSGGYWDFCDFPLKDADAEALAAWPLPSPDDYDYHAVKEQCRQHRRYAVHMGGPGLGDIINSTGMLRTMEQVLVDMALEDEGFLAFVSRKIDWQAAVLARTLEAAAGGIDLVWMGEDLGTQIGPTISLEMYRRLLRPQHQKLVDVAKAFDLPVMIHSCGSSSWVFNDFIDMGIDVVDTLQPEARDMAPAYLKATYGNRLAFHGCISTAGPLAYGTVEETRTYCREILDMMMPGGGYLFAPTHQIQDNTPTENAVAMYETARVFGRY